MCEIKKTCLYDRHVALGARMSPFGGFDMPIEYAGIVEEHNAVRNACGLFDVSHMGEVEVSGPEAESFVNHIFTNDLRGIPAGKILYGMMLNEDGGVVDDLLVYRLPDDRFLLVINASNIDKDMDWIRSRAAGYDVEITDLCDVTAELALQGPEAEERMGHLFPPEATALEFYTFVVLPGYDEGRDVIVSRTGYTGEDGFEIYGSPEFIGRCWDTLVGSGVQPCGLGCRDTLRFEVGLPLYGDELAEDITPLEACLSVFVKPDKGDFIGREAILRQKEAGVPRKLVGLELADRAIPRHGYEVVADNGETVGYVTTGYRGISVDKSIAAALVDARYAANGTKLNIRIRRKIFPAIVTSRKFYKKSYKK